MVPHGNPMGNIRNTYCPTLQQLVQWMSTRIPKEPVGNLQSQSHYILACDKEFSLAKRASGRPSCWAEPLRPGRLQRDSAIRWVGRASSMAWPRWRMRLVVNRCVMLEASASSSLPAPTALSVALTMALGSCPRPYNISR